MGNDMYNEEQLAYAKTIHAKTMRVGIDTAIAHAVQAHNGVVDKEGFAYIFHPLRVMEVFRNYREEYQMVAVLHDVKEDNPEFWETIKEDYPYEVSEAIDFLSRREGEVYNAFIRRCKGNKIAVAVKLADLDDNIARNITNANFKADRLIRYIEAKKILLA